MKKWKANRKKILIVLILILLLVFGILMYGKVSELTNQLAYLQDTTNIILSDVGGMQSSIEKHSKKRRYGRGLFHRSKGYGFCPSRV